MRLVRGPKRRADLDALSKTSPLKKKTLPQRALDALHRCLGADRHSDAPSGERARPQLSRFVSEAGDRAATLVSGWIPIEAVRALADGIAMALGQPLGPKESARLAAALAALPEHDEEGLEWSVGRVSPVRVHFIPERSLVAVDVLLEGAQEERVEAVHHAFASRTVAPPASRG